MPIGALEPLYRYLKTRDKQDPFKALFADIESLAQGGYIIQPEHGKMHIVSNDKINTEIAIEMAKHTMPVNNIHVAYNTIGDTMSVNVMKTENSNTKTLLSAFINPDDTVTINYIDPSSFSTMNPNKISAYSSTHTSLIREDGTIQHGFIRVLTDIICYNPTLVMRIDFKLARTKPFYLAFDEIETLTPTAFSGDRAKELFESLTR